MVRTCSDFAAVSVAASAKEAQDDNERKDRGDRVSRDSNPSRLSLRWPVTGFPIPEVGIIGVGLVWTERTDGRWHDASLGKRARGAAADAEVRVVVPEH